MSKYPYFTICACVKKSNCRIGYTKPVRRKKLKNFKDYPDQQQHSTPNPELDNVSAEELTKRLAGAYNGKSSGNMFAQILKEAEKSKRAGTLSNEELDAFYQQFSPMVSPVQRKMLQRVIHKLKEI